MDETPYMYGGEDPGAGPVQSPRFVISFFLLRPLAFFSIFPAAPSPGTVPFLAYARSLIWSTQ